MRVLVFVKPHIGHEFVRFKKKKKLSESVHDYFVTGGKSGGSKIVRKAQTKIICSARGHKEEGESELSQNF